MNPIDAKTAHALFQSKPFMKKILTFVGATALTSYAQLVSAQIAPQTPAIDTRALEKAIETPRKSNTVTPVKSNALAEGDTGFAIALLQEVRVSGTFMSREVSDYWLPFMRKPVSAAAMLDFKKWVYARLDEDSLLGYVDVKEAPSPQGSTLLIEVVPLTVGSVTVVAKETGLGEKYAKEVARRFAAHFNKGQTLNVSNLEAQLNAAAFDLPVSLDVDLRTNGRTADISINMASAPHSAGSFQSGFVQLNNYGLAQYGRAQALGAMRFDGFTPLSTATVGFMASERVAHLRAEYDHPLVGSGKRLQFFASTTGSSATLSQGTDSRSDATEFGLRLNGLLNVTGDSIAQWGVEVARRDANDSVADIQTARYNDQQVRLRLRKEKAASATDYFNNELVLIAGALDLSPDSANQAADEITYQRNGAYQKLELSGGYSKPINEDRSVSASARWRAQWASKTLHAYNQISLGGPNGIRAYHSADGTGDAGAVVSFDITKTISPAFRVGLLYDIGRVERSRNPNVPGLTGSNNLELQGAGIQFGGEFRQYSWNTSIAKSFGMGQDTSADPSLTSTGDWRINLEVTRPF